MKIRSFFISLFPHKLYNEWTPGQKPSKLSAKQFRHAGDIDGQNRFSRIKSDPPEHPEDNPQASDPWSLPR